MTTIHVKDEESRSAALAAVAMTEAPFVVEIGGGWQPIETAPKDGTEFQMACVSTGGSVMYWVPCGKFETKRSRVPSAYMYESNKFVKTQIGNATHWRVTPDLPELPS